MDQNRERRTARAGRDQSQRASGSVLGDKETFLHAPRPGSDQPSHDMQEMGQGRAAASAREKSGRRETGR